MMITYNNETDQFMIIKANNDKEAALIAVQSDTFVLHPNTEIEIIVEIKTGIFRVEYTIYTDSYDDYM